MSKNRIAITGATGILGSWVLATALRRGYDAVAIMRDAEQERARRRLRAILALTGIRDGIDHIEIVRGDATADQFGLSSDERDRLGATVDGIIHCAACTSFSPKRDAEVMATNVDGTRSVLEFCAATDTPLFHISTAYVCGRRDGVVLESDLAHDEGFNNTYEFSKHTAEHLVGDAIADGAIRGALYRPSIIVGATGSGHISEFCNFYQFVQAVEYAVSRAAQNGNVVKILGDPGCTKNMIPVDWAAAQLMDAIEAEGPSGKTYHLTHPEPTTMGFIAEWLNGVFADSGVRIELTANMDDLDGIMRRASKTLQGYVDYEPTFDRTHMNRATQRGADSPPITKDYFTTLYRHAKQREWRNVFDTLPDAADAMPSQLTPAYANVS